MVHLRWARNNKELIYNLIQFIHSFIYLLSKGPTLMQIIYIISVKGDNKKSVRNRFSINLIVTYPVCMTLK